MPPRNSTLGVLPLFPSPPVKHPPPRTRAEPPPPSPQCQRAIGEQLVCSTLFVVLNLASVAVFIYSVAGR